MKKVTKNKQTNENNNKQQTKKRNQKRRTLGTKHWVDNLMTNFLI